MKLEIRPAEIPVRNAYYDDFGNGELEIYITREDYIEAFEVDETACIKLIQDFSRVFVSTFHFARVPSEETIRAAYDYLKKHPKTEGIVMQIIQDDNAQIEFGMEIVKSIINLEPEMK